MGVERSRTGDRGQAVPNDRYVTPRGRSGDDVIERKEGITSSTTANVVTGALEGVRASAEAIEIVNFVEVRVRQRVASAPTLAGALKRSRDRVDWLDHFEYGSCRQAIKDRHFDEIKKHALKEGVKETDTASSRLWCGVEVSREAWEATVAWLMEQKIISSDHPRKKSGIRMKKKDCVSPISREWVSSQTRERYKALVEVTMMLNTLEKHLDHHMADVVIKVLGKKMEEQLHAALTHRLSSTVGKTLDRRQRSG